jgi:predicted RNase H-like nuclease (RuvC/YqgF family)
MAASKGEQAMNPQYEAHERLCKSIGAMAKENEDLKQHVTQLENRLRALWDKLEGERKHYMEQINRTESFINRFLDPEDLGYAVNNYVRDDAREALGRERVESKP